MEITAQEFLEAKFSQAKEYEYLITPNRHGDDIRGGDLLSLLEEFKALLIATQVVQLRNPRTDQFTTIDKDRGCIIGAFDKLIK
ncbi:MAG: hypothetical protein PHT07_15245 [Paludibacter sp.]|nr:hypothetical protein [Paludibacter sp.]